MLLVARPAWLERSVGLDALWGWHRWTGMTTVVALLVHLVASSVGFADGDVTALVTEIIHLMGQSAWMVAAVVSAALFLTVAATRLPAHQALHELRDLAGDPYQRIPRGPARFRAPDHDQQRLLAWVGRWWWIGLFVATVAAIVWSRVGGLVTAFTGGRGTITRIVPAADDTAAIEVQGVRAEGPARLGGPVLPAAGADR